MRLFQTLLALPVLVFGLANAADSTTINQAELKVEAGQKYTVPRGSALLVVDSLVLEKDAIFEISPGTEIFTIKAKRSRFAEGSSIVGIGPDGSTGQTGGNGTTLHLYLGEAQFFGTTINTQGGTGGKGVTGSKGRNGQRAFCPDSRGKNGDPGGKGGTGGNGGKGGDIFVTTSNLASLPTNLLLRPAGGGKGAPGDGGPGGDGGGDTKCGPWPYWYLGGGYSGPVGPQGDVGKDGASGQVEFTQVANADKTNDLLVNLIKSKFPKKFAKGAVSKIK